MFVEILRHHGRLDMIQQLEGFCTPEFKAVEALVAEMDSFLTEENIFSLIGPRHPNENSAGVEILLNPFMRLIVNRFGAGVEIPPHDHGGLSAVLVAKGNLHYQNYDFLDGQLVRQFGPGAHGKLLAGSFGYVDASAEKQMHSFTAGKKGDVADIAVYFRPGEELGRLIPWRSWEPGSCANCRLAACRK